MRTTTSSRQGLSFVEFVGCLTALGGGIAIGAVYLGLDVKTMAVGVLEKADIQVPAILAEDARPQPTANPQAAETVEPTQPALETEAESQVAEVEISPAETFEPLEGEGLVEQEVETTAPEQEYSWEEQQTATQTCWQALNACIHKEATKRNSTITDPQNWTLFDYLLNRKACHEEAVHELEAIEQGGVEPRLRAHLQQVLAWHRAGATLYERATLLLTDAPAGKLSGPFAQSWQSAATQHRMEEKLILSKHASVGSYLEHAFKEPPATAVE